MRRALLLFGFVLLLCAAGDASAQCQKCHFGYHGCAVCVSTNYDAAVPGTINNGWCVLEGEVQPKGSVPRRCTSWTRNRGKN